ncbi:hypothetical protein LEMLEM_LOCUS15124, partial [Lemmus lemmus]
MPVGQKRAPDPITDGCEPPYGCWELNSGPLEEQAMLLPSEPFLQPLSVIILVLGQKPTWSHTKLDLKAKSNKHTVYQTNNNNNNKKT